MHERFCPECGKELSYTTQKNRNQTEKKKRICRSCRRKEVVCRPEYLKKVSDLYRERYKGEHNPFYGRTHSKATIEKIQKHRDKSYSRTEEYQQKMSRVTSGTKNPMYGRNCYDIWVNKYGTEEAGRRLAALSAKRSKNAQGEKNPMYGKPPPHGAGHGLGGWYKGWYFRSLKELSYMIYVIEANDFTWENAEQKKLSIPYIDHLGHKRTYRADFLVNGRILIEVKPKKLMDTELNSRKRSAAEQFCKQTGYEYHMVDVKTIDATHLKSLAEQGLVVMRNPDILETTKCKLAKSAK